MKNSRKFVGDAIPLKEPDFTLERITLLRVFSGLTFGSEFYIQC